MQYDLVTILSHVLLLIVHQLRIKLHLVSQQLYNIGHSRHPVLLVTLRSMIGRLEYIDGELYVVGTQLRQTLITDYYLEVTQTKSTAYFQRL